MTAARNEARVLADLERHFAQRLHREIHDIAGTCNAADVGIDGTMQLILTGLFYELVRASAYVGWDEREFLDAARMAYRAMRPHIEL